MQAFVVVFLLVWSKLATTNEESDGEVHCTNSWAVHIEKDDFEAVNNIAQKHGFINQGQVKWVEQQRILEWSKGDVIQGEDELVQRAVATFTQDTTFTICDPFKDQWYLISWWSLFTQQFNEEVVGDEKMRPRKRRMLFLVAIPVLVWFYVHINLKSYSYYTNQFWKPVVACENSEEEINALLDLTYQIHMILDEMKVRHWLMYGSIWGAMRMGRPLPWDNDVDIGYDGEGTFAHMMLSEFIAPFKAAGLTVKNKWTQSGTIVISKEGLSLAVDLFAYYNHGGVMRRRGLESWIFALNYRTHHSFPAKLVEAELPQTKFGFFNISIPKGGIEIMKHLYPYNWWKVVPPAGC